MEKKKKERNIKIQILAQDPVQRASLKTGVLGTDPTASAYLERENIMNASLYQPNIISDQILMSD